MYWYGSCSGNNGVMHHGVADAVEKVDSSGDGAGGKIFSDDHNVNSNNVRSIGWW